MPKLPKQSKLTKSFLNPYPSWKRLVTYLGIILCIVGVAIYSLSHIYRQRTKVLDLKEVHQVTELPAYVRTTPQVRMSFDATQSALMTTQSVRLPILMYHYVEYVKDKKDTIRQSLDIQPHILAAQIETLKKDGYLFITPSYLTLALQNKIKPPEKIVMLTFDDGYRDFYTDVFPILQKEQVPAVSYVVANFIGRPNNMTLSQLKEVAASPWVEIGAHTMNHVSLKGLKLATAQYEIIQSRKVLQELLHVPVNSFAYPYGAFDVQAEKVVQEAGFTDAVSTVPGIIHTPQTQYFLYRLRPGGRTGEVLLKFLQQSKFTPW